MMQLVADDIQYQIDQQDFIQNSRVSFTRRQPEILLGFDQILLTTYGITRANITTGLSELNSEFSSGTTFKVVKSRTTSLYGTKHPKRKRRINGGNGR